MTYFIRQLASSLATPLVLALLLAGIAALVHWRRRPRLAWALCLSALAVAYLGAINPVAAMLLGPLEDEYPPLRDDHALPEVAFIVVLGSGYRPRGDIPVTAALDGDGLVRIVEGVRLARRFPAARLVASGGAPGGRATPAEGYARLARSLGVQDATLLVVPSPLNTEEEASAIAPVVGAKPFLLVTSAYHMPRAVLLMRRAGLQPVPAPTGQRIDSRDFRFGSLLPGSAALANTERALHEYLGLAVLAMNSMRFPQ